jgi:hypothetical protein
MSRARRAVSDIVEASLPAGITSRRKPEPGKVVEQEVDAELAALEEADAVE